ncbi:hypothetical protein [Thermomonospora umbrina]|uniref:Uncharacterized protein n=1 Tax=Thermomonospora umbrina TaxID=111806 RepID=A0A3D9SYV8_9ACTN|nr:hypothetical protein [Thermomonospora umbrina]REE97754.1 hypothetical protein DFJ69_3229 [Thermomonospora umbrina]
METHSSPERPSQAEAAAALEAVEQARSAGTAPIPGWFFPALGLLGGGLLLSIMLPLVGAVAMLLVVGVGVLVTHRAYYRYVNRSGIAPRKLTEPQGLIFVWPLPAAIVVGELLEDRGSWVWGVAAVLVLCWAIGFGVVYNGRARASK